MNVDFTFPSESSESTPVWGAVTGDITNQSDLIALTDTKVDKVADETLLSAADQTKLDNISITQAVNLDTMESDITGKQDTLVSGTNIKTVNSTSLLGSGDIVIGGGGAVWGAITGTLSDQTDLKAVTDNKVDKVIGKGLSTNDYTDTDETKIGFISVTQAVDLDTMKSDIATNNAKVGITAQQASDITTNNAKISFDTTASTKVSNISVTQAVDLDTMESDIATNTAKISFDSVASTKVSNISVTQLVNLDTMESDIATNTAKVTSISDVQIRTASFSTSTGNQYNKCNSATAINATLNSGIPIGSTLAFSQANVGEVTFVAGTGVTLEPTGKKLVEGSATAICIATDTYRLDGNLEDV